MPVTLTPQQVAELERSPGSPFEIEDPQTRRGYVLVPREAYLQARPLFEAIIGQTSSCPSSRGQDQMASTDWNDAKNTKRCALIDKRHDVGLSPAEESELNRLQAEFADHQRLVAPRPLAILELLEEALQQRAARANGDP